MKIGIITLSGSDNCGSLLQTYALQTYLKKNYDCSVDVIDYLDIVTKRTYGIFAPALLMRPIQLFRTLQYYKRLKNQKMDYAQFRREYLTMTDKQYHSYEELKDETWDYDIMISGSDQIWNWPEPYVNETYFLKWVPEAIKKIAYAASTGGSINNDYSLTTWTSENTQELKIIHDAVIRYSNISIREESGKRYFERMLNTDVPIVADPTLMLDRVDWETIVPERIVDEEYIFYYSYGYKNMELNRIVQKAARKIGLPVYVINASLWNHTNADALSFTICPDGGPLAYLSLMKNAKYVFAESFHGCIFAFIFKKNFWFLNNLSDGKIEARIKSLLGYLELEDRVLHVGNFDTIVLNSPINYERDFSRLQALRKESANFLDESILGNKSVVFDNKSIEYDIASNTDWITMSDEEICDCYSKLRDKGMSLIRNCTKESFEQYFHVSKEDFLAVQNSKEYLVKLKSTEWYKEKKKYHTFLKKYGYLGHLLYRTKQTLNEKGLKGVIKGIITKYKWWFRIGY